MFFRNTLLAASIIFALGGCMQENPPVEKSDSVTTPTSTKLTAADADQFIVDFNNEYRKDYYESTAAAWIAATYINQDSEYLVAKVSERDKIRLNEAIAKARQFAEVADLKPETKRALELIKLQVSMPAPKDLEKLSELTKIASSLEAAYGSGKDCKDPDDKSTCRDLGQLSEVLAENRDWDAQLDAWEGWHNTARNTRKDYTRFVELINEGATEMGYADAGELWRSGYDMSADDFRRETDRLWSQVEPLYDDLQCYAYHKLAQKYPDKMPTDGTVPAHITGNMWAQDWAALYPMLQPYAGVNSLDVDGALQDGGYDAKQMLQQSEAFYVSLGMPALPESIYELSQLTKPRDREVVCHASAWDMNLAGDVRLKMCIKPTEEEYRTIYHELGHIYYYLAYNGLEPIFQGGAHDGFNEAIGDTVQLSLTPAYMQTIGLVEGASTDTESTLNTQMKMALEKVVFLPFGKLIDEWRWGVFDGSITPELYNTAWWELRKKYQGITPAITRTEADFDPGAKYHVPGNTPYARYFLSHILQFQFHKALCDASGFTGPLHECSIYNNKAAGEKYWAMLQKGASQTWQQTMQELTGGEQMDAQAVLEYFAPLQAWLKQQNEGQKCGW